MVHDPGQRWGRDAHHVRPVVHPVVRVVHAEEERIIEGLRRGSSSARVRRGSSAGSSSWLEQVGAARLRNVRAAGVSIGKRAAWGLDGRAWPPGPQQMAARQQPHRSTHIREQVSVAHPWEGRRRNGRQARLGRRRRRRNGLRGCVLGGHERQNGNESGEQARHMCVISRDT